MLCTEKVGLKIILIYLAVCSMDICGQCRPRPDTAECGDASAYAFWSESTHKLHFKKKICAKSFHDTFYRPYLKENVSFLLYIFFLAFVSLSTFDKPFYPGCNT